MEKKIAIYKRYSTDSQDMKTQDKDIADYLEYKKIDNSSIIFYSDEAESGVKLKRPQFQKLMKDVEENQISSIIATKLDRIARSNRDLQNFLHILQEKNISLIIIKDNIDTKTTQGKLFFDIMAAFAEWERNVITERMKSGKDRAKLEGKLCHRHKKQIDVIRIKKLHDENKLSFNSIQKIFKSEGKSYSVATIISRYKGE